MPQPRKAVNDNCVSCSHSEVRVIHRPIPIAAVQLGVSPFELVAPRMPVRPKSDAAEAAPSTHWFHGSITREDTERLLKHQGHNGTFLIRYSTSTHNHENCSGHSAQGSPRPTGPERNMRIETLMGVRDLFNRISAIGSISLSDYVNEKSADSGATPLIEAAKTGSNDIVRLLLEHGALVNLRDCGGFTALHRACQKSFAHVAETLLRVGRANPQIKCPFSGNTALHEAAMLGHADCVNCLLRFHAAPWARNAEAEMPFELALRYGFADLAAALAGYKPTQPLTTQADWYHPNLTKSETDRFFTSCAATKDGAFLIRRSSQSEKKFVLVLYYQRQTLKYQIEVIDFSFHMDTKEAYFIDKGPLHLSLEHLVEHYSRFADGIPVRLHYAVSPAGMVLNIEQLVPPGLEKRGKELKKIEQSGGEAWALRTITTGLHGGRMGAPLAMPGSKNTNANSGPGKHSQVLVQPSQRLDFLKEATIMMQLSHPHIVTIYGVCENKRLMMILELAELGSLLDYLLDYPERCQLPELYNWAMQVGLLFVYASCFTMTS
ncbi:Tyrosine-protein kinase [Fasciola gigantica]|uniref:Tyrosine-protein kinase n=1 Tax=Fasciola gigantica TaxID=46835 RepID=A0A504Y761_FASGI|nr:Tyrosine-protein kinase [Fasciola gigantica]